MGFLFAALFSLPTLIASPIDSTLLIQSKEQAQYYISQIQDNANSELHIWTLAQLCNLDSKTSQYINQLSYSKEYNLPLTPFCIGSPEELLQNLAFKVRSPDLLISALLETDSASFQQKLLKRYTQEIGFPESSHINYEELASKIINSQNINNKILPTEQFTFVHFLLFFNKKILRDEIITKDYLKDAANSWYLNPSYQEPTLSNSLFQATLFLALYKTDDYSNIEPLYRLLYQDKLFPISNFRLRVYQSLDYSMYRLGYYDRSLEISRSFSIPLAKYLRDKGSELSALILQGVYLIKIGKMNEAQDIYLEVLEQSNKWNISVTKSSLYTNLSITYLKMGEYDKYLDFQFKALKEAENQNNYSHQLDILNNLYIFYRQNGDPNTASLYLEEATKLAESYGSQEDQGVIYTYMGTFYKKFQRDYKRSLSYFKKADAILNETNHFNYYLNLLYEKGKLHEELQNHDQALTHFSDVITLSRNKSIKHHFEALVNKAAIHLRLQELDKTKQLLDEINDADFDQIDFEDIVKAKTVHANYLIKTDKPDEAYAILKPVIEQTVDWAQNSTDTQTGFWNIEQDFLDAFQLTADLLIETDRPEEAVEVLDQLKTINDASLYQNPMVKSSLLNESELTQYQRLTTQLDQLRKDLLASSGNRQLELQSHINRLSAQKRTLDRKITSMVDKKPSSVRSVQSRLDGYEAVVHTTELNDWYYIATIFRNKVSFEKVRLDSSLRSILSESVEHLASGKTDLNNLYQVSKVLGLNKLPSWIEKLIVIPDSYLYQLPIDILPLTRPDSRHSYGETTYLVERFNTHYLTSLNDFNNHSDNRQNYKWNFVGYGVSDFQSYTDNNLVPLPYAQTEVSNILANLTNLTNKTAFVDSSSNKETFKSTAKDARILHLATHSEVSERDPLFSSIYLSQHKADEDANFPGQVFAHELFGLNLSNDLIMLNSCESGSGSYLQGTGVMGISRALRYAGANSLVLNLWSVNDMLASEFATQFYKQINEGNTKAEALRAAKIHMLKNKNANPHYWGTYVLIGKDNSILEPSEKSNTYLASSFMLYFIILVIITLLKDKQVWRRFSIINPS